MKAAGFTNIDEEPGGGGTNPDANVKVARGQEDVAVVVRDLAAEVLGAEPGAFTLRSEWAPDDGDIFINLGPLAEKMAVQIGQDAPEFAGLEWLDGGPRGQGGLRSLTPAGGRGRCHAGAAP